MMMMVAAAAAAASAAASSSSAAVTTITITSKYRYQYTARARVRAGEDSERVRAGRIIISPDNIYIYYMGRWDFEGGGGGLSWAESPEVDSGGGW